MFQDPIQALIETQHSDYTCQRYAAALAVFMAWYAKVMPTNPMRPCSPCWRGRVGWTGATWPWSA